MEENVKSGSLRLGIIGAGAMGAQHAGAAQGVEGVEVAAVAEVHPEEREKFAKHFKCKAYAHYEDMLAQEHLGAVVVALPNLLHCQATVKAAQAGCHVLVEKPLAVDLEECDQMIEAAKANEVKLMVGHNYHSNPYYLKAKEIVESGEVGRIVLAWDHRLGPRLSSRASPPDWYFVRSQGGGMLMMNGVHFIGRLRWLVGSPVVAVKGMARNFAQPVRGDDTGLIVLHFANGVYATIQMVGLPGSVKRHETELVCEKGMIKILPALWVSTDSSYKKVAVQEFSAFTRQLSSFVEAIRNNQEPPMTGEMGKAVIAIVLAVE